jgi:hypothetical protein
MSNTLYYKTLRINVRENRNNPEKLATLDTQDTIRRQTNQKHNTTYVGHHYAQAS